MTPFEKSRRFIYQNARPLDLARWQYHFEDGSKEAVLSALAAYQNEDGGFGHGLEADCFNPHSSPIQTWAATEVLREIGFADSTHPIVKGILGYLASGQDFDRKRRFWLNTIFSNNDYPHAVWWTYKEEEEQYGYNPTACLAGFFVRFGDSACGFYDIAVQIAKEAYRYWLSSMPYADQHTTACFIRLYEYCIEAGIEIADMDEFRQKLIDQVTHELHGAAGDWGDKYVVMPSDFIQTKDSIFCAANAELITKECEYIVNGQQADGSFEIPWKWWTDYAEFEIARNWWKADFCIRNMRFLREFKMACIESSL